MTERHGSTERVCDKHSYVRKKRMGYALRRCVLIELLFVVVVQGRSSPALMVFPMISCSACRSSPGKLFDRLADSGMAGGKADPDPSPCPCPSPVLCPFISPSITEKEVGVGVELGAAIGGAVNHANLSISSSPCPDASPSLREK